MTSEERAKLIQDALWDLRSCCGMTHGECEFDMDDARKALEAFAAKLIGLACQHRHIIIGPDWYAKCEDCGEVTPPR